MREFVEMLENIIAGAGDLIENRSPELVAHARGAVHDGLPASRYHRAGNSSAKLSSCPSGSVT